MTSSFERRPAPVDASPRGKASVGNRLHRLRTRRGWTLPQLATISGVSASTLRLIERGSANPTMTLLHRIAFSLGLPLGALTETDTPGRSTVVLRGDDPRYLYREEDLVRTRALSPLDVETDVEVYEVSLRPGGRLGGPPSEDHEWVVAVVEQGWVSASYGGAKELLGPSDAASFPARGSGAWENNSDRDAVTVQFEVHGVLGYQITSAGAATPLQAEATAAAARSMLSLLAGRVRAGRARRGWTLAELASRSGVSRSMLSQIERAESNPTLTVVRRISSALSVDLHDLVSGLAVRHDIWLSRAGDDRGVHQQSAGVNRRLLSPPHLAGGLEVELITLDAGAFVGGRRETRTWQRGWARSGIVEFDSAGEVATLQPGDSAYAPADEPFRVTNMGAVPALLYAATIHKASAPD